MTYSPHRRPAIALQQAAQESPVLAQLSERIRASSSRLQAIQSMLPEALRSGVQAGPIDDEQWCLLVRSNATAAKLRQLLPALQMQLQAQALPVRSIRIKVRAHGG